MKKEIKCAYCLRGTANLIRYDFNGNKTIIGHFVDDDIFGEVFYPANTNNELFAVARKNSEILFFTYDTLFTKCRRKITIL